ncbi:voltage-gated potassium channel [Desulfonispora thiosulfatigenes DSM 11270]|uniref:Voltage-gated potassium channel n=1 Tax=Desulfonispora thiosulfatigenes DSM 11270 TaxID=656914 RepID=A0A1W1V1H1_DESTI|nr:potassium channel protein [Desulfonispora thiosulfatigenes]SMB87152.1 voltage-gated potassium channel [Desulfonispora thiosulfatigenes DSM 11270]
MIPLRQRLSLVISIVTYLTIGTIGFKLIEGISFFKAFWLMIVSVLTIGYGDIYPITQEGKIFALVIIPIGVVLITYNTGIIVSYIVDGKISRVLGRRRMDREISKIQNHIIICGLGRVGQQVAANLAREKDIPLVIIDKDIDTLEKLCKDAPYIVGDASEDSILYEAGIERCAGLVTTLPEDADNVLIVLTAKGINNKIKVVARSDKNESKAKLLRAGANTVINPSNIGGNKMAMSIIKPTSVEYIDRFFYGKQELGVEEIIISENSLLINQTLSEANIRSKWGVSILAIKREDNIISNPHPGEILLPLDLIIVFGSASQLDSFEKVAK